jgi:hypothetical protein
VACFSRVKSPAKVLDVFKGDGGCGRRRRCETRRSIRRARRGAKGYQKPRTIVKQRQQRKGTKKRILLEHINLPRGNPSADFAGEEAKSENGERAEKRGETEKPEEIGKWVA